jgi:hydrogenase maturation protease
MQMQPIQIQLQMCDLDQAQAKPTKIIVLGIGNTLMSDDGAGIHVIRSLQQSQAFSRLPAESVEILDGGTLGYLLIDRVADADGLVIIDAANLRAPAGTIRIIDDSGIEKYLEENPSSSVHEVGLIDLLQMMSLNESQPKIRALVGIQPAVIDWGVDMSPEVAASIPLARAAVETIVGNWATRIGLCQE